MEKILRQNHGLCAGGQMEAVMEQFRNWKKRVAVSAAIGMLSTGFFLGGGETKAVLSWWGTMYPRFCFTEIKGEEKLKISFWLAKAFDWC